MVDDGDHIVQRHGGGFQINQDFFVNFKVSITGEGEPELIEIQPFGGRSFAEGMQNALTSDAQLQGALIFGDRVWLEWPY